MSFPARLLSDNYRSLEYIQLGALSSPATPKEKSALGLSVRYNLPLKQFHLQFPRIGAQNP